MSVMFGKLMASHPGGVVHPRLQDAFTELVDTLIDDPNGSLDLDGPNGIRQRFESLLLEFRFLAACEAMRWGDSQSIELWKESRFDDAPLSDGDWFGPLLGASDAIRTLIANRGLLND
jgi:hypothetical protein